MKDIFLLDADETLLDFSRGERKQLIKTLRSSGVKAGGEMIASFHAINDALWKELEQGKITRRFLVVERFRLLFEKFGVKADAERAAAKYYSLMKRSRYLFDGAAKFLSALRKRGRIYIVTNGSAQVQKSRLKKSGIARLADGVFISEEVGADKPARAFAEYVEGHIGNYARGNAVWLGDSLTSDMPCAASLGIDFVLFGKTRPEGYTGKCAASYGEALEIFDKM